MTRRILAVALLAILIGPWATAQAGVRIAVGVDWPYYRPYHPYYYRPAVVVAPAPVVVAPPPAPVYVVPAQTPVYVQPAPVYTVPPPPSPPAPTAVIR